MCDDDDDTLFRYVFDDLGVDELAAFEARLRDEPDLAKRLEEFRQCLAAQEAQVEDSIAPVEMPRKLADRTARTIGSSSPHEISECVGRKRFSLVETAAVGVCALLIGMVALPAIQSARESSRRLQCTDNLRAIYTDGFSHYADENERRFPSIAADENAGMFAVKLADRGYLTRETLQKTLLCPSSDLAHQVGNNRAAIIVPTRQQLGIANAYVFDRLIRFMAGSYAYRFGHLNEDGAYIHTDAPCEMSCRAALMADTPHRDGEGAVVSRNHSECGQNVLFKDGHVDFVSGCWSPGQDHLFLNDAHEVAAGRRPQDAVLAPSQATPGATRVVRVRFFLGP